MPILPNRPRIGAPLRILALALFALAGLLAGCAGPWFHVGPPPGPHTIVYFGDSIAAGFGLDHPESESFPALIQKRIDSARLGWSTVNASLSGETTVGGESRLAAVLQQPFGVFVLELGSNDGRLGYSVPGIRSRLQAIVGKVRARYPAAKIVLAAVKIPAGNRPTYTRDYAALWPDLAAQNHLALTATGSDTSEWVRSDLNSSGSVIKISYPDGASSTTTYDNLGRQVKTTDPDGVATLTSYDSRGRVYETALDLDRDGSIGESGSDRVTQYVDSVVPWGSSSWGLMRTVTKVFTTSGSSTTTTASQEDQSDEGGFTDSLDGLGNETTSVTSYATSGGNASPTNPSMVVTVSSSSGSVVTSTSAANQMLSRVSLLGGATMSSTVNTYDAGGRVTDVASLVNGTTVHTVTTYNASDQALTVTRPDPDGSGGSYTAQTTTYSYDDAGRVHTTAYPDGSTVETVTYYPTGKVLLRSGGLGPPEGYTYDSQGRELTFTTWKDFAGSSGAATTTLSYDAQRGWLTGKTYAGSTAGPSYTYTAAGRNLTRTWARGVTTTFSYGNGGDLATVSYSDGTPGESLTYDRLGGLAVRTDAAGQLAVTSTLGIPIAESWSASVSGSLAGLTLTRSVDASHNYRNTGLAATGGYATSIGYDGNQRLASIASGSYSAAYGYSTSAASHPVQTVTFSYGASPRLASTRTWDLAGRLTSVAHSATTTSSTANFSRTYHYNALDQRTGVVEETGCRWDYGYDAHGQVASANKYPTATSSTALPGNQFAWTHDDIGNRQTTTVSGRSASYTTNALNQYTQRDVPGYLDVRGTSSSASAVLVGTALATLTGTDFYSALLADNSTGPISFDFPVISALPGTPDQVASTTRHAVLPETPEARTYDADGNLTQDGLWTCAYDGENRPVLWQTLDDAVTAGEPKIQIACKYDGQGRRVAKKINHWVSGAWSTYSDTRFLYDGWNLIEELDALNGDAVIRQHVWGLDVSGTGGGGGIGSLLFSSDSTGVYAPAFDGNGNIVAWVNATSGTIAGKWDYGPFAETIECTGVAQSLPFAFSTKYLDRETGLYYYGYRFYDPSTGRWTSLDPMGEKGGLNLYCFVKNSPVNQFDLFGLYTLGDATISLIQQNVKPAGGITQTPVYGTGFAGSYPTYNYSDQQIFDEWYKMEKTRGSWWISLPRVPKCISIVNGTPTNPDPSKWLNPTRAHNAEENLHPGTYWSLRGQPDASGHANQGTYDKSGRLLVTPPSAGTADWHTSDGLLNKEGHFDHDVAPAYLASKLDGGAEMGVLSSTFTNGPKIQTPPGVNIMKYYEVRPFWPEQ